jgi:hypothetical protein
VLFFFAWDIHVIQTMLTGTSQKDGPDCLRLRYGLDIGFILPCGIDIAWQDDTEDATLIRSTLDINMSAVALNDLAGYVESQSQTVPRSRLYLDTWYAVELLKDVG